MLFAPLRISSPKAMPGASQRGDSRVLQEEDGDSSGVHPPPPIRAGTSAGRRAAGLGRHSPTLL